MDDSIFTTPRLNMRLWRDGDDARVEAIQTPTFMRWLQDDDMPVRRPGSITERQRALQAAEGFCFWVVERKSDGAFLGYCGLKRVDAGGTALTGAVEIGWGMAEEYWGEGYATEAAQSSLSRAFQVYDAPFVIAFTVAGNQASWRVMKRIGMERRADLDFHDPAFSAALNPTIVYRIDAEQWRNAR